MTGFEDLHNGRTTEEVITELLRRMSEASDVDAMPPEAQAMLVPFQNWIGEQLRELLGP